MDGLFPSELVLGATVFSSVEVATSFFTFLRAFKVRHGHSGLLGQVRAGLSMSFPVCTCPEGWAFWPFPLEGWAFLPFPLFAFF